MDAVMELRRLYRVGRDSCKVQSSPVVALARYLYYRARGKKIAVSGNTAIYGLKHIQTDGMLRIGLHQVAFTDKHDHTLLRIEGRLRILGDFSIGRGCRVDVGKEAYVELGAGYVNPNTIICIMHGLRVGSGCAISWGCQILDEDFHELSYPGKKVHPCHTISIGDNVWIGSNVTVLKGASLPNGSVVATGSLINSQFSEPNTLIAGRPGRVIKTGVSWH